MGETNTNDIESAGSKASDTVAAPIPDYYERCEQARCTEIGDNWQNIKTGKTCVVTGRGRFESVDLLHESGRRTNKQYHYLASDCFLIQSNSEHIRAEINAKNERLVMGETNTNDIESAGSKASDTAAASMTDTQILDWLCWNGHLLGIKTDNHITYFDDDGNQTGTARYTDIRKHVLSFQSNDQVESRGQ